MMQAEIDIWCACGVQWGFMVWNTDGVSGVHACPKCGELVTATVNVQYGTPDGVSTEGASWAMEATRDH